MTDEARVAAVLSRYQALLDRQKREAEELDRHNRAVLERVCKVTRNARLYWSVIRNGGHVTKALGREYGISTSCVRQIFRREHARRLREQDATCKAAMVGAGIPPQLAYFVTSLDDPYPPYDEQHAIAVFENARRDILCALSTGLL